ncbi:MAG: hypothetical protein HC892_08300 [Saprospiraceae bacterium]|nr:hypothetical protein [Saprospiraceae bacterium]
MVKEVPEPVRIQDGTSQTDTQVKYALPYVVEPELPDTCVVKGTAQLQGNLLLGSVELDRLSPCGDWTPYAMVKYVHPGHRDIALEPIRLEAGTIFNFQIKLDERDLARSIHPLNVTTFITDPKQLEGKLMSAFWMRANTQTGNLSQVFAEKTTDQDRTTNSNITVQSSNVGLQQDHAEIEENATLESDDQPELSKQADAINVVATDPNCTQINDLQLVYDVKQSSKPLYIAWLSPRCCQEGGCEYTIWSGVAPNQLKLSIKGFKSGTYIRELIDPTNAEDQYFEVVVKTPHGTRKAAYGIGKGAMYGVEEILAYHDELTPQKSDTLVAAVRTTTPPTKAINEPTGFAWDTETLQTPAPTPVTVTNITYNKPNLSIHKFVPCQTQDQMRIEGDIPIQVGDVLTIDYPFDREGYKYTLYFQPEGKRDWFVAPDTEELYEVASFTFKVGKYHTGNYVMLLYKPEKTGAA